MPCEVALRPSHILGVGLLLTAAAPLSACAKPIAPLNGQITEVEIIVPEGKLAIVDWIGADREASKDGFVFQRLPLGSNKPTREEQLALAAAEKSNAAYRAHLASPEVQLRAQEAVIPRIEEVFLSNAAEPMRFPGVQGIFVANGASSPELRLVLRPTQFQWSFKTSQQKSAGSEAGEFAALMAVGLLTGPAGIQATVSGGTGFQTDYEIVEIKAGNILFTGTATGSRIGFTAVNQILLQIARNAQAGG